MLSKVDLKQTIAYLLLAMFMMLVYQYVISISDPTESAVHNDQKGLHIEEAFLVDLSSELTLSQLLSDTSRLVQQPMSDIPWSFTQQAYWIYIVVHNKNQHAVDMVSHFSNPMLEQLTIYQVHDDEVIEQRELGWQVAKLSRLDRSIPSYEILIPKQDSVELYVRIATEGIAKTPINFYLKDDFSNLVRFTFLIWGSFVGILIAMSLYNLVLFLGLRDSVYLVYIGYITSVLMMLGVVIGFGHYIWPESIIRFLRVNIIAANTSLMIFTVAFALLFFNALEYKTRVVKFCTAYLVYLILFAFISLFLPEYVAAPIFFLSMAIQYPAAFLLIVQQYKINYRWARLYIISWVPLILGGAIQPMGLTGVIDDSFIIHHALMIGVLFEIVFMAMALAKRMQYKKEEALYNATHDPETQLANTNLLESKMKSLLRNDQEFAVCIIEITDFSSLLPYISHADNNDLMVMVGQAIERNLCHEDNFYALEYKEHRATKLAKLNDGVFAVLAGITSKSQKEEERLKKQLAFLQHGMAKGAQVGNLFINLTTSVGISLLERQDSKLVPDIIKQAYQALEQGRRDNLGIGIYQPKEALNVAQRLALASDLQQALRQNELELYHQPQMNLDGNNVDGSEVLLRWKHREYGFIAPDVFIQLAEDTGIINELTLWVVDTACQHLESLIKMGYQDHNVSVNISGKDISEVDFLKNVKKILARYNIPLSNLTFELTESVMVNDFHHLSQIMNELSVMGIQVSIDDYGTGYSSLLYISQLPFNEIKIDKSFVMDLESSKRNLTIVRATIEMAKNLELKVVAEGVESQVIEDVLKSYGCHIAQGYYYQRPVKFSSYVEWLNKYISGEV